MEMRDKMPKTNVSLDEPSKTSRWGEFWGKDSEANKQVELISLLPNQDLSIQISLCTGQ